MQDLKFFRWRWGLSLVLSISLCVLLYGCIRNQLTGSRGLVLVPDSVMDDLGSQSYREMKTQTTPSRNGAANAVTLRAAERIAKSSGANFDWEFALVESQDANAFCLPGGKIMVYSGILEPARNEAGLAFILGHEVGHAVARHGAQRVSQALLAQGALITLSEFTSLRTHPQRELILAGMGLGAQVGVLLPFSRSHESEADQMGLIYMAKAGYDPREAPKFWQRMGKAGGAKPPEFLSTHPSDFRRRRDLNARMSDALAIYNKTSKKYALGDSFK